jgi:hypothetical protein
MKLIGLVLLFISIPRVGMATDQCRDSQHGGPQFLALGAAHKYHVENNYHYSLSDFVQAITVIKPDLICGEVTPEAFGSELRGYFPPEQRVVEEVAKRIHATYVPSDWRAIVPPTHKDPATERKLKELQAAAAREILEAGDEEFAFRHSEKHQREIKAFHDLVIHADGEGADGFWLTRNKKIVDRCLDAALRTKAKRVLFVFGGDHNYIIKDILESIKCTVTGVPKIVHSSQQKLDLDLVPLWAADRKRLEKILQSDDASLKDQIQGSGSIQEIRGSDRLHDLDLFINSQSNSPSKDSAPLEK